MQTEAFVVTCDRLISSYSYFCEAFLADLSIMRESPQGSQLRCTLGRNSHHSCREP